MMKYKTIYLLTSCIFFHTIQQTLLAHQSANPIVPLDQAVYNAANTTKDILMSIHEKTTILARRTKKEAIYFIHELRNIFKDNHKSIAEQDSQSIAQSSKAIRITIKLANTNYQQWTHLINSCNKEISKTIPRWQIIWNNILHALKIEKHRLKTGIVKCQYLQHIPTNFIQPDIKLDHCSIIVTCIIKEHDNQETWNVLIKQAIELIYKISYNQQLDSSYDSIQQLINNAIDTNSLDSIAITAF